MNKGGRPPKVNIEDLISDAEAYIQSAKPPIIAEYAHLHGITRQRLYQLADKDNRIFDVIKRISEAKEVDLEKGGLSGKYNASIVIFSLKQLGWKDKIEQDVNVIDDATRKEVEDLVNGTRKKRSSRTSKKQSV